MEPKFAWLIAFVSIYWAYCLFWGFKGARSAKTSTDYFLAGRSIGIWVFVLAATATSFSGWTFVGHPGKIFTDGLPYAFASFYALTIPFTGVLFLRRQWVLGKAYRYITPGEMYSDYYGGNSIRLLTVLVAFLFSVPYLGVQLRASGALFNVLTDGLVSVNFGMFTLSAIVMIYVASGGLRSVAFVDCAQAICSPVSKSPLLTFQIIVSFNTFGLSFISCEYDWANESALSIEKASSAPLKSGLSSLIWQPLLDRFCKLDSIVVATFGSTGNELRFLL